VKELHADSGRAMEVFFHITANPGDEVSVRHTAALLRDPARSSGDVLREVLQALYGPHDEAALDDLARLFRRADAAYFDRAHDLPASATISMEPLVSDHAGPPVYLTRHLDRAGLDAYEREIAALLGACPTLATRVARPEKIETIGACLQGVLADVARAREMLA
jgi:hypothetical protein